MVTKEYTDKELIEEITMEIEKLGGSLTAVEESTGNMFKLVIDQELQEQAHYLVTTIADRYKNKRKELLLNNPLLRAKQLREEIYG